MHVLPDERFMEITLTDPIRYKTCFDNYEAIVFNKKIM
jgi:hypothetical protein